MSGDIAPFLSIGLHQRVSEATYHADPCERPSASSHALKRLLSHSPDHARYEHPRLNAAHARSPSTSAQEEGTILHALTLDTPEPFVEMHFADFRKADAQAARDAVRRAGLIPIKSAELERLRDIAATARARLRGLPEVWAAFAETVTLGHTEVTAIWEERDVLCRARFDTLPPKVYGATYDLKFTGVSAEAEDFSKKVVADYAIQAELYPRAVRALRGDHPNFVFVAIETDAPFGVTLHCLGPEASMMAAEQVDEALDIWKRCMRSGLWPSYPTQVHYAEVPPWVSRRHEGRSIARQFLASVPQKQLAGS